MTDYRPFERRRAPYPPSRGVLRARPLRQLPRLQGSRRFGTDDGELFISARIPDSEHQAVLARFERHAAARFGRAVTIDGEPYTESSFESERGQIRLVTSVESAASYAYYDWEEKP